MKNKKHKIIIINNGNYDIYKVDEKKLVKNGWFFRINDEAYAVDKTKRVHVFLRGVSDEIKDLKVDKNEKILRDLETARLSKILLETKVVNETFNKENSTTVLLVVTVFIVMISAFSLYLNYNNNMEVKKLEKIIVLQKFEKVNVNHTNSTSNSAIIENTTNATKNITNVKHHVENVTNTTNSTK